MDGASVLLLGAISFIIPTLLILCATLYYYITTKKFNKNGTVTYGEIVKYEYGDYNPRYDLPNLISDYLYIKFNLDNQEHTGVIDTRLPSKKKLEEKYAIGSKKKIKVLKTKKGDYEIRLLKENKENASYWKSVTLAIITALTLSVSLYFFLAYSSYKEDMLIKDSNNNVNYNQTSNNPYIQKFATLNEETIESMNTKFGVQGKLENPNISQSSYVWEVKDGMKIKGTINSEGKVRSVELEAQDDEFYDSNVKFDNGISTLNGKQKITYEEVKSKCGSINGNPTRISNGKANTYVWVNSQYKLTITVGSNGYVTSLTLKPR